MAYKLNPVLLLCKNLIFIIIGAVCSIIIVIYCILSSPVFLYRYLISKVFAPCFLGRNVKMVTTFCDAIAVEVLNPKHPPRCNTLVNIIIDGHITYDKLYQDIQEKWIDARDKDGNLQFPEFQQKLMGWMGYIFWKTDPYFNIKNHLILHKLEENGSEEESEKHTVEMCEGLLNHRWDQTKSPWQMHLVQNYKNSEITSETGGKLSMMTFCINHCLADGYALLHLLLERLGGHDMESALIAQARNHQEKIGSFKKFLNVLKLPYKIFHEIAQSIFVVMPIRKSYVLIPDNKKAWKQLYARGQLIPTSKLKLIKKTFGASFVATLNTVCSAALGKTLNDIHKSGNRKRMNLPESLVFAVPVPRPNHPKKLRIHVLGSMADLPLSPEMNPVERLRENEACIQKIKHSVMPMLSGVLLAIIAPHPSKLARFILKNQYVATGVTSFPGPGVPIKWTEETKLVGCDFAAGIMPGNAGTAFMVLSCADKIRFCATAESAVLSKEELNQMLTNVSEEVDILYELALRANTKDSKMSVVNDSFEIECEIRE